MGLDMGLDRGVLGRGDACGMGGVGHSLRVRSEARVGQRISTSAGGGRGVSAFLRPSEHGGGYSVGQGRASSGGATCASLFSREGGSPVWVPAFAGKHVLVADWDGCLLGLDEALPHGARSRGHAPPRPSPEGEGVFVVRHHRHHRHRIMQPRRVTQCVVIPAEAGIHILGGR